MIHEMVGAMIEMTRAMIDQMVRAALDERVRALVDAVVRAINEGMAFARRDATARAMGEEMVSALVGRVGAVISAMWWAVLEELGGGGM
mgnify:CR=1 FL=1